MATSRRLSLYFSKASGYFRAFIWFMAFSTLSYFLSPMIIAGTSGLYGMKTQSANPFPAGSSFTIV